MAEQQQQRFLDCDSLDQWTQGLFESLMAATRASNKLPRDQDYGYFTSFVPFKSGMAKQGERVLGLTQRLLEMADPRRAPKLLEGPRDVEDVSYRFNTGAIDVLDTLLEAVDNYADDATGDRQNPRIMISKGTASDVCAGEYRVMRAENVGRPQQSFEYTLDNSASAVWCPILAEKPNAKTPLDPSIVEFNAVKRGGKKGLLGKQSGPSEELAEHIRKMGLDAKPASAFPHPYEHELQTLAYEDWQLSEAQSEPAYAPLGATPCTWVDSAEQVDALVAALRAARVVAIDLEHHDYRSFQGFTCLMQISAGGQDWVVDTLALRSRLGPLNAVFTDPAVVKVLHGMDWDVVWLQRDLGLYLVNAMDTGQAARALGYQSASLKYMLERQCGVIADKRYQLADWRVRPIPAEMLKYAREDTHYLEFVYHKIKSELLHKGGKQLLQTVLDRSRDLCLKVYEPPRFNEQGHLAVYNSGRTEAFLPHQIQALKELFAWRDATARLEDESTRYVMPNAMLLRVAQQLPADQPSLLACYSPPPPSVRVHATEILAITKLARQAGEEAAKLAQVEQAKVPRAPAEPRHTKLGDDDDEVMDDADDADAPRPAAADAAPAPQVLSTEQLYKVAGWEGEAGSGLFSESGDALSTPKSRRAAAQVTTGKRGTLFDDDDDDEDDADEAPAAADESRRTATLIAQSIAASPQPKRPEVAAPEAPAAAAPSDVPPKPAEEPPKPDKAAEEDPDAVKEVPRSMEEIYKLSNMNRKRNKEKKRQKEESMRRATSPEVVEIPDDDDEKRTGQKRSKARVDEEDKSEFMRRIGWKSGDGAAEEEAAGSPAPAQAPQQRGAPRIIRKSSMGSVLGQQQGQKQTFVPYDYSTLKQAPFTLGGARQVQQQEAPAQSTSPQVQSTTSPGQQRRTPHLTSTPKTGMRAATFSGTSSSQSASRKWR
eukprot:m51a1_g12257 putative exosome component 10 (939) ;mRNA; f:172070-175724